PEPPRRRKRLRQAKQQAPAELPLGWAGWMALSAEPTRRRRPAWWPVAAAARDYRSWRAHYQQRARSMARPIPASPAATPAPTPPAPDDRAARSTNSTRSRNRKARG